MRRERKVTKPNYNGNAKTDGIFYDKNKGEINILHTIDYNKALIKKLLK